MNILNEKDIATALSFISSPPTNGKELNDWAMQFGGILQDSIIKKMTGLSVEPDLTPLWFLINAWQEAKPPAFDLVGKINGEVLRLVSEALAAARVQSIEIVKAAYFEGFFEKATYNDRTVNDVNECWEESNAIRALIGGNHG